MPQCLISWITYTVTTLLGRDLQVRVSVYLGGNVSVGGDGLFQGVGVSLEAHVRGLLGGQAQGRQPGHSGGGGQTTHPSVLSPVT